MPDKMNLLSQFYIQLNGNDAEGDFMTSLEQVRVENSLHLPDMATLILNDAKLKWIDHSDLELGTPIRISAQAGTNANPLFDGEIIEIEPDFTPDIQRLIVRAFDRLHRLNRGHHARTFVNVTDADLVEKIAQEVGLQAEVGPTSNVYDHVFQANETNLSFLQRRAAELGYLLYVEGKKLYCMPPQSDKPTVELRWGETLQMFQPRMTTVGQTNDVTVRGWDPEKKQEIIGRASRNGQNPHIPKVKEKRDGGTVAQEAFHMEASNLITNRPIRNQAVADTLAQATAAYQDGSFMEAEGTAAGNPSLVAGVKVHISAVGDRFTGEYFVTSTAHIYHVETGYATEFTISGLRPVTLLNMLMPQQQSGTLNGLVIGIVTDNKDPKHQGRVRVMFPWLAPDQTSDWARIVMPGAGDERGMCYLPEIDDEVLVGFEMGDIQQPYILGGLWNGKEKPPMNDELLGADGKVQKRIIRSRLGHEIILDDSNGEHRILIKTNKANGKITIEAQGEVDIKGSTINLEAQGEITLKGATINLN